MVTSETYVPNAKNVIYDEANDVYRVANKEGVFLSELYEGLDDRVYWDLTNATFLFPSSNMKSYIDSYEQYEEQKRLFYLPDENGKMKDYSSFMSDVLYDATLTNKTNPLYGKVAVNAELMHIMLQLTKAHDGFGGIKNSWQMMCYYHQPLGQK